MDIGKQQRVIEVEPEPLHHEPEFEPLPAPEPVPAEVPEPVPAR